MSVRVLAWFSCGAASAVAAKLAVEEYGESCEVCYCWTMSTEHPDNARFLSDIEKWLGKPITILQSQTFATVDDVFKARRYLSGIKGAPCTGEMKKVPRLNYQRPNDVHIFGYTAEEATRIRLFQDAYPDIKTEWPLLERGLSKTDCLAVLKFSGIALPVMYQLGFRNNNCLGCVKATSGVYWDKVRRLFPSVFARRVAQSRAYGVRLVRHKGKRIFLDELPSGPFRGQEESISCGPDCGIVEVDALRALEKPK